jgi:hypothetical protein
MADFKVKNRLVVTGSEAIVNGEQVSTTANTQTLTNKTISGASNTITNIPSSALATGVDATKIADGSVTNAEFQYLNGVTSDIQTQINSKAADADVIKKDGSVAFTAAQSMGGFKLTGLAAGTASSDAVTKGQQDAALEGLKPKTAVRVATTANITIATDLNVGDVVDGVTLANGDRVLVKDQTSAELNGIYAAGATPTRSTDFDSLSPIDEVNGSLVAVQEGTTNAGKVFVQSGVVAVLDTDPINFVFFNSASTIVGGDGITVSGTNISVDHDGQGLQITTGQLALELDGTTLSKSATGLKVNSITSVEVSDFAEAAQDAVGNILTNTTSIEFTYNDALDEITAIVPLNGITNNEISSGVDAAKIADGSVSNAEFQYLDGVTSAIQTQLNSKAADSTVLKKDGSVTATGALNMGGNNITNVGQVSATTVDASQHGAVVGNMNGGSNFTLPSGSLSNLNFMHNGTASRMAVYTVNSAVADASATSDVNIETGNKTAGTGNSGNITIRTGTSAGGTRGSVSITAAAVNVNSAKITNLANPTSAQDAATKDYVDTAIGALPGAVAGDIQPTSFTMANNQISAANVTGLAFANATTRSFKALIDIKISATADLYEAYEILGVQKGSTWDITQTAVGDDSGVVFSITTAGQIQYTSTNVTGFTAGAIKFRASTIPVA